MPDAGGRLPPGLGAAPPCHVHRVASARAAERTWARDGYAIVDRLLDPDVLDYVWSAYKGAID